MIAMLVISIMLIIRDMAKTILAENLPDTEELPSLQEGHPQKERVEKYAASFQKLAPKSICFNIFSPSLFTDSSKILKESFSP